MNTKDLFKSSYFENYGGKGIKYESSMKENNYNLFYKGLSTYKKEYNKLPSIYIELGCGNGKYLAKAIELGIKARGCDFADYFDNNLAKRVTSKMFFKEDVISFLEKDAYKKCDFIYDNCLQYLEDDDMFKELSLIEAHSKKGSVLCILYDHFQTKKEHPRPQIHSIDWWVDTLKKHNFYQYKKNPFIFIYKINKSTWNKKLKV